MNAFYVVLTRLSQKGKNIWFFFETDCESVADFSSRLNRGQLVSGFKLNWREGELDGERVREVYDADAVTLRLEDVKRIAVPNGAKLVRVEDDAAQ